MRKQTTTVLAIAFAALCLAAGCKKKPTAFPLSLATLEAIHSGQLSFEEQDGEILVSISDASGDRHIHRVDPAGHSRKEVLEILQSKQEELEKAGQQGANAKTPMSGGENWTVLVGDWPVEAKDIPGILAGGKAYLEQSLAGTPSARERGNLTEVLAQWPSYSCQLLPVLDRRSGRKMIGMQFFPAREQSGTFSEWRTEPLIVKGGGNSFWHLTFDPEKHDYSGFAVNADQ